MTKKFKYYGSSFSTVGINPRVRAFIITSNNNKVIISNNNKVIGDKNDR